MIGTRNLPVLLAGLVAASLLVFGALWSGPQTGLTEVVQAAPAPANPAEATPPVQNPVVQGELTLSPVVLPLTTPTSTPAPTLIPTAENAALSLLILHTADTRGYTAPCG